ncbi:MAG: BrnA antitoxin family protein [Anaerolineae bacterium]|nr:BrnA antitoxin family protein [Anaerolineae bacterium]
MDDKQPKVKSVKRIEDRDPLPEYFASVEEMAEFWDTHDSADYEDYMGSEDVAVEVNIPKPLTHRIAIEETLMHQLQSTARKRGISAETLVNLWLQEKISQEAHLPQSA